MHYSKSAFSRFPVTIYYEDTDAGGVVYHANYLKFFERGRTEMLREQGVCQRELLEQNMGFVVRSMELDFLKAARLDDNLVVITQLTEKKKASLIFCQELVNPREEVLCRAIVKVACIDIQKMKPQGIPDTVFSEK
ncbi:Acyl-CoA thioester hydrolase YbgC [Vibrio ruber DSM 16370]|uniref:Acyl-CoA thioester hydrolase YbgC n=1 Tax=Vibrio ruber (strain DSM 16370 / JCM 11486 / BCRC 17186 / CECT 7878 / LMG 23124 / VR1) TaxID=1123498 RepID=A0A1R4LI24_VIBR1|nr:Acyl-CoA thioester hydrolase YbgC [Vibrio ruber DSM 16370]